MYLFVISIILAVVFLLALAMQIAYIFIYARQKKADPVKTSDLTTPLEYLYTITIPLAFIQLSSFVLNNIAANRSEVGNYVLPDVGLIFGSIYNSVLVFVIAYIIIYRLVLRKNDKLTFYMAISVSAISLIVSLAFTMAIM